MKRWLGYLLLTAGAFLILRARASTSSGLLDGLNGGSGNSLPGQIGSNFFSESGLGSAVRGLGDLIAGGFSGKASVNTAEGTLSVDTAPDTLSIPWYQRGTYKGNVNVPIDSPAGTAGRIDISTPFLPSWLSDLLKKP